MNPKLIIYAVAAIAAIGLLYGIVDRIGDAREAKVVARYEKQIAENVAKALQAEAAQRQVLNDRSQSYETRIAELANRPEPRPIRVPKCPSPAAVPSASTAASQPSQAPADKSDGVYGEDFGATFRGFARECATIAIQLDEVIQAQAYSLAVRK